MLDTEGIGGSHIKSGSFAPTKQFFRRYITLDQYIVQKLLVKSWNSCFWGAPLLNHTVNEILRCRRGVGEIRSDMGRGHQNKSLESRYDRYDSPKKLWPDAGSLTAVCWIIYNLAFVGLVIIYLLESSYPARRAAAAPAMATAAQRFFEMKIKKTGCPTSS